MTEEDFPFKVYDPTKEAEELLKNHSPLIAVKGLLTLVTSFRQTHAINSEAWSDMLKRKDSEIQQLRESLKELIPICNDAVSLLDEYEHNWQIVQQHKTTISKVRKLIELKKPEK